MTIIEPSIVVNPSCVISAIVRWSTDQPASSWVEFGEVDNTHRIGSDALTTDHEVVVVGMYADTTFTLDAVSETANGAVARSAPMSFTAGPLPFERLQVTLDTLEEARTYGGWTLFSVSTGNLSTPILIQLIDIQGRTVWYYSHPGENGRLDTQSTWLDGTVLYGPGVAEGERIFRVDLTGQLVWEGPLQVGSTFGDDGTLHHVCEPANDGGILTARFDNREVGGKTIMADGLREFDQHGNVLWSWDAFDHTDQIPLDIDQMASGADWLHINSTAVDDEDDAVYFTSWVQEKIYKIDRATGRVLWILGEGGDFAPDPTAEHPWFGVLHALEYLGDNRFILYDNSDFERLSSRAVIYQLDEETMQATEEWSYSGRIGETWFNNVGGDADILPNGNVLIVGGNATSRTSPTRIMEVSPAGRIVWRVFTWKGEQVGVNVFQAERIDALAQPL